MIKALKKTGVYALSIVFVLSGCVTNGGSSGGLPSFKVGPKLSSFFNPGRVAVVDENKTKLDIIVPVFDPGLSEDGENYKEKGVWPELRRAEANRFAYKMKLALEKTKAFGAVRVTPNTEASGDLYVIGKIIQSNGEDVEIGIKVVDIAGNVWIDSSFDHTVDEGFDKNPRKKGQDSYDPVFEDAANYIAIELEGHPDKELANLQKITALRFAANLSEDGFKENLKIDGDRYQLVRYPSPDDPMLERVRSIRVRDQLFVDELQEQYQVFSDLMEISYLAWQEQSREELKAASEARKKAAGEAALGVLAIGLAVLAVAAGSRSNSSTGQSAGLLAGVAAGATGAGLLQQSFQTSAETEVYKDALEELGQSIDIELSPRVMAFEKQTVKLTGTAKQQFQQWRDFLQKIYEKERTPNKKL